MRYTSIAGLSEERRIPRVGKIRLGEKVTADRPDGSTYERPSATDHFVVPPEVAAVFGERPTSLEVMFPADDRSMIFPVAYKFYKKAMLYCTGNGVEGTRVNETGGYDQVQCPCPSLEEKNACRHAGSLMMMLPRVSIGGVYQLDTPSKNNIIAVQSGIEHARGLLGHVAWIPFILSLAPRQMTVEGRLKTVYLLNLVLASFGEIEDSRRKLLGLRSLVSPSVEEVGLLVAAPEDEVVEEGTGGEQAPSAPPAATDGAKAPPPAKAPAPAVPAGSETRGVVDHVDTKTGKNKKGGGSWTRYGVAVDGEWYGTFEAQLGEDARALEGSEVILTWKQEGEYKTLLAIRSAALEGDLALLEGLG